MAGNVGPLYLLDSINATGAAAAYSLRRLTYRHTGSAIRVRRSSDNAEQDIGFDGDGNLNTAALLSFVGYQNLFTYSEQFENSSWSLNNVSVNSNVTNSPISTLTADKIVENTANAIHATSRGLTVSVGTTYYWSIYLKAAERTYGYISIVTGGAATIRYVINIDLNNGNVTDIKSPNSPTGISYSVTNEGNGWYRCSVSITATSTTLYIVAGASNSATPTYDPTYNDVTYPGISGYGIYVWGAQLNTGNVQSYQQTTTATRDGNGFITTWYDQSNNNRNATQTTAARQPRIVGSGIVDIQNNRPSPYFNTQNNNFLSFTWGLSQAITSFIVAKTIDNSASKIILSLADNVYVYSTPTEEYTSVSTNYTGVPVSPPNQTNYSLISSQQFVSGNTFTAVNGIVYNGTNTVTNAVNSFGKIGSWNGDFGAYNGYLSEMIIYQSNQSTNRPNIEANINNYYKIY